MKATTYDYTMSVPNNVASLQFTLKFQSPASTATLNGAALAENTPSPPVSLLEGGSTTVTIVVTAQDGVTQRTYTVSVSRAASSDATLSSLVTSVPGLVPTFSPSVVVYNVTAAHTVGSFTITPTANHPQAQSITVEGTAVASGSATASLAVPYGTSARSVTVTAQAPPLRP